MAIFEDDFLDMIEDMYLLDKWDREKQCKKKCPYYKTCKANFKKCKYAKKKKGWFF
jgi:hypothetical protein